MGVRNIFYFVNEILVKITFCHSNNSFNNFFQNFFRSRYSLASNTRDGETIFRNVCANYHLRGGLVVTKGSE